MHLTTLVRQTLSPTAFRPKQRGNLPVHRSLVVVAALLMLGLCGPKANAQGATVNTLFSFNHSDQTNGASPFAGLTNVNGTLYGTTLVGGASDSGTVFSIDTSGHLSTLHSFNGTDGSQPYAALTNINGTLYGTTAGGGAFSTGAVFSIDSSGHFSTLYSFSGADGAFPRAGLTTVNGTLYGTTSSGGAHNDGTIFAISTSGSLSTLHSFNGTDGLQPYADLTSVNGTLYGTTLTGGAHNDGTVFAINTDGTAFQTLHSFSGTGNDGVNPIAGLTNVNGTLYGTTEVGGATNNGTIFSMDTSGHLVTLYSFNGTDGMVPGADLLNINGTLYGTTLSDSANNQGTVFAINTDGTGFRSLHTFRGQEADRPLAGLTNVSGTLYGTTVGGGAYNDGTVFALTLGPTTKSDAYTPKYQTAYVVKAPGVLGNDDGGGSPMTAALVSNPTHGTITLNADGSFTYTPAAGFVGADTFTYQAVNTLGKSNTATVTLTVYAAAPLAHNDTYAPRFQTAYVVKVPGVLANDTNYDTGAMTATLVSGPTHGILTFSSDGSFTYTPSAGFVGADSFTYKDTNPIGTSTATVTLNVTAAAPVAHNDTYTPKLNTAYRVQATGVLANDNSYAPGALTAALVTTPSHGTLAFNSDGSFLYTPGAGFTGTDSFTYKDTNAVGTSNTATVTLNVQ